MICKEQPCVCMPVRPPHDVSHCIDFNGTDLIAYGSQPGFEINLTRETITTGFVPTHFRTDNGKWKEAKQSLTPERFPRLFNKDMVLQVTDNPGNENRTVTFPKINKRAALPKLRINYLLEHNAADAAFGQWVFVTKQELGMAVKNGIQVGLAIMIPHKNPEKPARPGNTIDENGWGRFYEDGGICVKPLVNDKASKTTYFFRAAPMDNGGTFTAASKHRQPGRHRIIRASSVLKAPTFRVHNGEIRAKADTFVLFPDDRGLQQFEKNAMIPAVEGMEIWVGATVKKPASARTMV